MKKKTPTEKIKELTSPARIFKGKKGETMKSDLNYIKKLIKLLNTNDVSEIEVEKGGVKIRVVKSRVSGTNEPPQILSVIPSVNPAHSSSQALPVIPGALEEKTETKPAEKKNLIEVHSPIVGTFYRAPSPNADPYVQVGQVVNVGTVLCIIEAMKLMNEIESEVNGKISEICVENAKPVEYNQLLFRIEPV